MNYPKSLMTTEEFMIGYLFLLFIQIVILFLSYYFEKEFDATTAGKVLVATLFLYLAKWLIVDRIFEFKFNKYIWWFLDILSLVLLYMFFSQDRFTYGPWFALLVGLIIFSPLDEELIENGDQEIWDKPWDIIVSASLMQAILFSFYYFDKRFDDIHIISLFVMLLFSPFVAWLVFKIDCIYEFGFSNFIWWFSLITLAVLLRVQHEITPDIAPGHSKGNVMHGLWLYVVINAVYLFQFLSKELREDKEVALAPRRLSFSVPLSSTPSKISTKKTTVKKVTTVKNNSSIPDDFSIKCVNCGFSYKKPISSSCSKCGKDLYKRDTNIRCKNCGQDYSSDESECPYC
jgi:hypothetical protein